MSCVIEADSVDDLMRHVLQVLLEEETIECSTRGANREVIAARLELRNPRARLSLSESRRRPVSAIAELCWYLSGSGNVDAISFWLPEYLNEAEETGNVYGAYGPRIFGSGDDAQVCRIVKMLKEHPGTRRAVMQIFDRRDILEDVRYKDVPCTSTIQFLIRDNRLVMIANMRSNDAYLGLPHDVFAFTMIQEIISRELDIELGQYVHLAGSLHLYERHYTYAEQFVNEGWQSSITMPEMPSGSQMPHIRALLRSEEQLRNAADYTDIDLPADSYWADLARILAAHCRRKRNGDVHPVINDIHDDGLREFARDRYRNSRSHT